MSDEVQVQFPWRAATDRAFTNEVAESYAKDHVCDIVTQHHRPAKWIGRAVYYADGRREMRDVEEWPAKPAVTVPTLARAMWETADEPSFGCHGDYSSRQRAVSPFVRRHQLFEDHWIRERREMSDGTVQYGEPERVLALPGARETWVSGESEHLYQTCAHQTAADARSAWNEWRRSHRESTYIARRLVQREGGKIVRILIDQVEEVKS